MPFSEKDIPICDTKVGFLDERTLGDTGLNFFDSSFSLLVFISSNFSRRLLFFPLLTNDDCTVDKTALETQSLERLSYKSNFVELGKY